MVGIVPWGGAPRGVSALPSVDCTYAMGWLKRFSFLGDRLVTRLIGGTLVYLQAEALLKKTVTSGLPFKRLPRSLCDSTPFVWVVMGLCINFSQARRAWEEEEADRH